MKPRLFLFIYSLCLAGCYQRDNRPHWVGNVPKDQGRFVQIVNAGNCMAAVAIGVDGKESVVQKWPIEIDAGQNIFLPIDLSGHGIFIKCDGDKIIVRDKNVKEAK